MCERISNLLLKITFSLSLPLQRGFIKYSETLLRAQERRQRPNGQVDHHPADGVQDSMVTLGLSLGAIGFGALVAYGIRQAMS